MPTSVSMSIRDEWENRDSLQRFLAGQLLKGRLALLLGAGTSVSFGLPAWPQLISRLFASRGAAPPPGQHRLEKLAEHFRRTYYKNDDQGYLRAVRDALYQTAKTDFYNLRRHAGLAAIGALLMSSSRGSASTVITFNFDDLLERYLEFHGFVTLSAGEEIHWSEKVDVTIIHAHGLLPSPLSVHRQWSSRIVLDQESFSKIIGKEGNPLRQELITILRTHTCLIIGLSGDDFNLDSVLFDAKKDHVALTEGQLFWGVKFTDKDDEVERGNWEDRGIYCAKVDYNRGLPRFLFKICQLASDLRRR